MKEKIVVILGDGMADLPDENGITPMSLARKPYADALAETSEIGLCRTVPKDRKSTRLNSSHFVGPALSRMPSSA